MDKAHLQFKSLINSISSIVLILILVCPQPLWAQNTIDVEVVERLETNTSLSPFEELILDINQTHMAWTYWQNTMGFYLAQYEESDLDRILQNAKEFKQLSLQKINGPFLEEQREVALQEYLQVYTQIIFLTLLVQAERIPKVNDSLSLTITDLETPIINILKSDSLIEEVPVFSLQSTSDRKLTLKVSSDHIEKTSQEILLMGQNTESEKVLLEVAKHLMRLQLENSIQQINQLVEFDSRSTPEKTRSLEKDFRQHISEFIASDEVNVSAFQPNAINVRWTIGLVEILFPEEEFTDDSLESLTTYINESASVQNKVGFLENVINFPQPLLGESENLRNKLCSQMTKSIQQGVNAAVFSLQEVVGKEAEVQLYLNSFTFADSCKLPSQNTLTKIYNSFRNRKDRNLNDYVQEVASIIESGSDIEEFSKQPIDFKSLIKFFQFQMLQENITLPITFRQWLNSLSDSNYQDLISAYDSFSKEMVDQASYEGSGFILNELAERSIDGLPALDRFVEFFHLQTASLPATNEEFAKGERKILDSILEFWLLDQQSQNPILAHRNEDKKTLIDLWSTDNEQNEKWVIQFLLSSRQQAQDSIEMVSSWNSLSDLEAALESSTSLVQALGSHTLLGSQFETLSIDLNNPNVLEESAKSLYHKYVFTGFTGLIALQLGRFLVKFKYPRVAAYISEALSGIAPQVLHKFMLTAISLIGVDLAYETHRVLVKEQNKHDEVSRLYHSSIKAETSLVELLDYERSVQALQSEKTAYFIRLTMDSILLGLPLSLSVPRVRQGAVKAYERIMHSRAQRLDAKVSQAFQQMGISRENIRFDKQSIDDFYHTKKTEIEGRLQQNLREIFQETSIQVAPSRSTDFISPQALQKYLQGQNIEINSTQVKSLIEVYRANYNSLTNLNLGHAMVSKVIQRNHNLWVRYAKEFRFDFERLQVSPGNWNWDELGAAYRSSKNQFSEGLITEKQFVEIEESYIKLMNFMMAKARQFSHTNALKSLYLNSIHAPDPSDLSVPTEFFNTNGLGEQFGYEVISLVNKESGKGVELIVPKVQQQRLIQ